MARAETGGEAGVGRDQRRQRREHQRGRRQRCRDRGVREWSAHALGDLAPQEDGVVRALVLSFEDTDDYVRWKAARALGNIGPRAAMALPLLRVSAEAESDAADA